MKYLISNIASNIDIASDDTLETYKILSDFKAITLGCNVLDFTSITLGNNIRNFCPVYIKSPITVSIIRFFQRTAGVYTPSTNFNGFGIYKYNALLNRLEKVGQTANIGTLWQGGGNTWKSANLVSPVNLEKGVYFILNVYSNSAQTTAPTLGGKTVTSPMSLASTLPVTAAKILGQLILGSTTLDNVTDMSSLTATSTLFFFALA
jgi:hypothetical protein